MSRTPTLALLMGGLVAAATLGACAGPRPAAVTPMDQVLESYENLRPRRIDRLAPDLARFEPLMDDATRGWWNARGKPAPTLEVPQTDDITLQTPTALLPARLYGPVKKDTPRPAILYFHGGGWVVGGLDSFDASARALAARTGAVVLSVHYRQAPEAVFPAAHVDALEAYRWLRQSAVPLGIDPNRIAIAGEGAGGNLALATTLVAPQAGLPMPLQLVLITPIASTDPGSPTMRAFDAAQPTSGRAVRWGLGLYAPNPADRVDPRLDPVRADLRGLPPTTLIIADRDARRSGAELLAARLSEAGVPAQFQIFQNTAGDFFGIGTPVPESDEAQALVASRLSAAFAAAAPLPPPPPPTRPTRRRVRHR
jgi:acetyl esterase